MAYGDEAFTENFSQALADFLKDQGMSEAAASRGMEMERATLNTYTKGAPGKDGEKRRKCRPTAELLARACILGFAFEFEGHVIVALKDGQRIAAEERQLHLEFTREFDLANNGETVAQGLKKAPGRVELTVSLKAVS